MTHLLEPAPVLSIPTSDDGPSASGEMPLMFDPLVMPRWDARLAQAPSATVFHTQGWAQVLSHAYGHRPYYLGLPCGDRFEALLPLMEVDSPLLGRRGVSLPFTDLCAPLGGPSEFQVLFRHAVEIGQARGWRYLELRGVPPSWVGRQPSLSFWGHTLDLDRAEEEISGGLDDSVRRAIRKAEKNGLEVSLGETPEDMRTYYELHCRTRQRHGLPPQPWRFFENLQRHVLGSGHGFVVTAHHAGQPVAGAVFLHFGQNATFKFGASDSRHQELRGNNLVIWRGIQACRQRECRILHFGRTSCSNEGLRRFKFGFGTVHTHVNYLRLDLKSLGPARVNDLAHSPMNSLFRFLPRRAARWVGAALYPHIT